MKGFVEFFLNLNNINKNWRNRTLIDKIINFLEDMMNKKFFFLFLSIIIFISCGKANTTVTGSDQDNKIDDTTDDITDESNYVDEDVYYDNETGLQWSKRSDSSQISHHYCSALFQGGFDDWDVPTIEQLETLLVNVPEDNIEGCRYAIDRRYSKLGDRGVFCSSSAIGGTECGPGLFKSLAEQEFPLFLDFDYGKSTYEWQECYTRCVRLSENGSISLKQKEKKAYESKFSEPDQLYMWSNHSPFSMNFKNASDYCEKLQENGFSDWRLPNISEWRTVVKNCSSTESGGECPLTEHYIFNINECKGCTYSVDGTYDKFGEAGSFWTSTLINNSGYSYFLRPTVFNLDTAGIEEIYDAETECAYARCVRNNPGDKRENQPCRNLPGSGVWNSVNKITQTWDGNEWTPSVIGVFNEKPSDKECRFKCKEGFVGFDNRCVEPGLAKKWSKRAEQKMNWEDAKMYCENLEENGKSDWHLPLLSELRTLIQNCPSTETGGVCETVDNYDSYYEKPYTRYCDGCELVNENEYSKFWETGIFWSSHSFLSDNAWSVNFFRGQILNYIRKDELLSVRCVRADKGETRSGQKCEALVEDGLWNSVDEITQTWNGSEWEPSLLGSYDEKPTTTECKYVCKDGYSFYNNVCSENQVIQKWSVISEKKMSLSDAVNFCENLEENGTDDWFLPSVSELRTLVKNCARTKTGGDCGLTDNCLTGGGYFVIDECDCMGCSSGWECYEDECDCYCGDESKDVRYDSCPPRNDIYYSKLGDTESLWTRSSRTDIKEHNWLINFNNGTFFSESKDNEFFVRCMRNTNQ